MGLLRTRKKAQVDRWKLHTFYATFLYVHEIWGKRFASPNLFGTHIGHHCQVTRNGANFLKFLATHRIGLLVAKMKMKMNHCAERLDWMRAGGLGPSLMRVMLGLAVLDNSDARLHHLHITTRHPCDRIARHHHPPSTILG